MSHENCNKRRKVSKEVPCALANTQVDNTWQKAGKKGKGSCCLTGTADRDLNLANFYILKVNDLRLRIAGEASQRSTKEDWAEWMRHFSIELLKESPSPALRTCARLAQLQVLFGLAYLQMEFIMRVVHMRRCASHPFSPFSKSKQWT